MNHRFLFKQFIIFLFMLLVCQDQLQAEASKFKIGVITALTGRAADYGISIKNSISLARKDYPSSLNNIEFIFEDAGYDTKASVQAFKKLIEIDHVDLVYVWGATFCQAIAPLAETQGVPMIAQCVDPQIAKGRRFIIRFMNYSDQYMSQLLEHFRSKHEKKFGVILAENGYLEEMFNALKRNLTDSETVTVIGQYQADNLDFRSSLLKLRNSDFNSVGVFLTAGQIAAFYKQMKEQHISVSTFGTNFFESTSEIEASAGSMSGAIYSFNTTTPFFKSHYQESFKEGSQLGFGALAYDFALLVGDLFNASSRKFTSDEIVSLFSQITERSGIAAGSFVFQNDSEVGKYFKFPIVLKQVTSQGYDIYASDKSSN